MHIILCADDYGISDGVSRGIVELITLGRLSATGVMVTEPGWPAAADALAALAGQVAIGLHLNLTEGTPLGPMPRTLPSGALPGIRGMIRRAFTRRLDHSEIAAEIERQLDRFERDAAMAPDFIDGHHHAHVLPTIRTTLFDIIARRYRDHPPLVRDPSDRLTSIVARRRSVPKAMLITALASGFRAAAVRRGLSTNQGFAGFSSFERSVPYNEEMTDFLKRPGRRPMVMCHPGYPDDPSRAMDGLAERRLDELIGIRSYPGLDRLIFRPTRDRDGCIRWNAP